MNERRSDEEIEEQNWQVVHQEEVRLGVLEGVKELGKSFGSWSMPYYQRMGDRMRASYAAWDFLETVLQNDEALIKGKLDRMAFELGYRLVEGRFEDSPTPERLAEIERSIEESRREARGKEYGLSG